MGQQPEKTSKDHQNVWDLYWKYVKEAGPDKRPHLGKSYYELKVYHETGYQPRTIRRIINRMQKYRPDPCF
jgi:hypothetical protein